VPPRISGDPFARRISGDISEGCWIELAVFGRVAYIAICTAAPQGRPLLSAFGDFPVSNQPAYPLMPHATASWLVDNTALTFEQIAEFCGLHLLEVQAMADDLAGAKYTGRDPALGRTDPGRDRARPGER
jgi:hypothetical protein